MRPARHQAHVEVAQGDAEEADPGETHVARVERRDELPELVAGRVLGEGLHLPAAEVPAGVARQRVEPQEDGVGAEDQRAHGDPDVHVLDPVDEVGLAEGEDGVVGQDAVEEQQDPEEVAVDVLQDQGEPGLAAVAAVGVGHATGRGREPEGPVVGLAVVVAGESEAEREDEDQQRRRVVPEGQRPEGVAARDAAVGDAGGVEGGDQVPVQGDAGVVVLPHEGRPRRVDDEGQQDGRGDRRFDPPAVLAQGGHVRTTPGRPDRNRRRGCALDRRRHSHLLSACRTAQLTAVRRRDPMVRPVARQRHKWHEDQSDTL